MPLRLLNLIVLLVFASSIQAQDSFYLRKKITDRQFRYEFFVSERSPHAKTKVTYYWFKGGLIHHSEGAYSGEVLDGDFEKFYLSNQLAEKGQFKNGKKVGLWKTWYENGVLATTQEWAGGQKNGNFFLYDSEGNLIEKGLFRANRKNGKWINYLRKDTLKYYKDKLVVKKEKKSINVNDSIDQTKSKKSNPNSLTNSQPTTKEKRDSFFKRLFKKKNKTKSKTKEQKNAKGK